MTRPAPAADARRALAQVMSDTVGGLGESTPLLRAALRGMAVWVCVTHGAGAIAKRLCRKCGTPAVARVPPEHIELLIKVHSGLLRTIEVQAIAVAAARIEVPQLRIVVPDRLADPAEVIEVAAAQLKRGGA